MAIDVNFYTFSKKPNSTKIPSGEATTYKCNLIEPTSFTAPEIALAVPAKPTAYNYAYIPEFSRYYYIRDWAYSAGLWRASLDVDYLASWKSYIGAQPQYILRSSADSDGTIIDTMYPTKNDVVRISSPAQYVDGGFKQSYISGTYIVGIINSDSSALGCVSYYAFTNSQFRALCDKLMGSTDWMYNGIDEISLELTKVLFNPFQYIASCMWIPLSVSGSSTSVKYGWWDLGVAASKISGNTYFVGASFEIPKHPQESRGKYLNGAPFSRYSLDWPCFGKFPIDANIVKDYENLLCSVQVDPVSGIGTLQIKLGDIQIGAYQAQIGVPIQIAQMGVDYSGVISNLSSAVGSAMELDFGSVFSNIGNAIKSAIPQLATSSKNGTVSSFHFEPILYCEFYKVVDDDNEHLGRPLCKNAAPSTLPGYIQCLEVEVEIPCTRTENERIVSALESGFYYE